MLPRWPIYVRAASSELRAEGQRSRASNERYSKRHPPPDPPDERSRSSAAVRPVTWRVRVGTVASLGVPGSLDPGTKTKPPEFRRFHGWNQLRSQPDPLCGRPLGCKRKSENSDGKVDCDHVFGLSTRHHVRWPRWVPRSSPKQLCGLEGHGGQRVLRIVGSTDCHLIQLFHPGIDARSRRPAADADCTPRTSSWPMPFGPFRCSITAEAARRFDRQKL